MELLTAAIFAISSEPSTLERLGLPLLIALVGSGVLAAALRYRPDKIEAEAIASKAAVEVFQASITRLEAELVEARAQIAALGQRVRLAEESSSRIVSEAFHQRDAALAEVASLRRENERLQQLLDAA